MGTFFSFRKRENRSDRRGVSSRRNLLGHSPYSRCLHYEPLEDRRLLSVWTVMNANDSGVGSLRNAIDSSASGDTVQFNRSLADQTIALTSGDLEIDHNLTIKGLGEDQLTINGAGNGTNGIFTVSTGVTATIEDLTLTDGDAAYGGAINTTGTLTLSYCTLTDNTASSGGAAIYFEGADGGILTISNCTFTDNSADGGAIFYDSPVTSTEGDSLSIETSTFTGNLGGGLSVSYGDATIAYTTIDDTGIAVATLYEGEISAGLINLSGVVTLDSCTIANNEAGGVYSTGTLTITDSTIADNSADSARFIGGVYNNGTLTVKNSTVSGNADYGIYSAAASITMSNSIVANTGADVGDIHCTTVNANYCLIENVDGIGSLVGAHNVTGSDPLLSTLGDHGGLTETMTLLSGSPAIDTGNNATTTVSTDQRGLARIIHTTVDMGAVEDQAPTVVTAASATPNPATALTTALSTLGADDRGESSITYLWAATGPADVTYSVNDTNAAKNTTATFTAAGSYVFTVTMTDSNDLTVTSSVTVVVDQTLTSIVVSPATAALNAHADQQFTAVGYDQFEDAMSVQPTFTWTTDVGTITTGGLLTASQTSVTGTVTATSGSVSDSSEVVVTNHAPTVATAAVADPPTVTAMTTALSVLGADVDTGETSLIYTWTSTGPGSVTYSANGTNAAKSATATFSAAGTYTFTATIADPGGLTATSSVIVIVDQTFTSIEVSPATVALNAHATQQFTAVAYDQFDDAMTTQPTFTWTTDVGTITTGGMLTAPQTSAAGTVTATSGAISGTSSVTVTNHAPTVATAADADPNPATGTTTDLSVLGADVDTGESSLTYTWTVVGPGSVTYSDNGTNAAKNATATFDEAGSYVFTVTMTDPGALSTTSTVTVVVDQTVTSISVSPATAALNAHATQQFTAAAFDQFGDAMTTPPTFTWTTDVGTITTGGLLTASQTTVTGTVTATSGSVSGSSDVVVTNHAPTVATAADADPNPVTGTTTDLSALGADEDTGESSLIYTWAATGPGSVTYSVNGTNEAKDTTATFDAAGSYVFTVTMTDPGNLSVTSTVTVVVDQTLTAVEVSPATAALNANATQQFTAATVDQFGDDMAVQPSSFVWSTTVGTITTGGLLTAPQTSATGTVSAVAESLTGTSSVTVTNHAPTVATAADADPNPATGTTTALSALGADVDTGESSLTYTWTVVGPGSVTFSANGTNAAKATTATFDEAGSYVFTVTMTDPGALSITSTVTVVVDQTFTSIVVSPTSADLNAHATQQFTAVAYDQFDDAMTTQPTFAWTTDVGTITTAGLLTASQTTVTGTVTATSGAISDSSAVTVTNHAPTVATAAAATPNPATGTTTALSALGADVDTGESSLTYTWTVTGPDDVTFSANGTNAAKATTATFTATGTYVFTVTMADPGALTATSTVTVIVNQTTTSIVVTPATVTLEGGTTQQYTAVAYDQFDVIMATQPTFAWTATAGTVTNAGLFTAPNAATTGTVTATSGLVHDDAAFTVENAGPTISSITVVPSKGAISWHLYDADGIASTSVTVDGASPIKSYGPYKSGSGFNYSANFGGLSLGSHSYTIIATDKDGAVSRTTGTFTVAGPEISNVTMLASKGTISWHLYDTIAIKNTTISVDGTVASKINGPYKSGSGYNYSANFGALSLGSHSYTIVATDSYNRISTTTGSFTVSGPVVSNVTVASSKDLISWHLYDAIGIKSTTISVDSTAPTKYNGPYKSGSGVNYSAKFASVFSVGSHSYTIVATDTYGRSSTTTGTFTIASSSSVASSAALELAALDSVFEEIGA